MTKERLWAIRSGRAWWMSKWANRSFLCVNCSFALSLTKNEWFAQKNIWLKHIFWYVFCTFFVSFFVSLKKWVIRSFPLFDERCEQIAQVANQKWANEQIAQVAYQKWANKQIARFFSESLNSSLFAHFSRRKKTSDSLRKPMSEFRTLLKTGPKALGQNWKKRFLVYRTRQDIIDYR